MGAGTGGVGYAITLGLHLVKVMLGANPNSVFSVLDDVAAGTVAEGVQLSLMAVCLLLGAAGCTVAVPAQAVHVALRRWWSTPSVWPWSCSPSST